MSIDASELAPIEETVEQPPQEQPTAEAAAVDPAQPPPDEPDPSEGLSEVAEQVSALKAALTQARGQLRDLKPLAQRTQQVEAELNSIKPYAEFVKNNPHLLQPQAPPAPVAPPDPSTDPQLVSYAKRFDLYTGDGKPDVERAKAILDDNRKIAREEAQALVAPLEQQTYEQKAAANLTQVMAFKDGDGNVLQPVYIEEAVKSLAQGTDKAQLVKMLADPRVAKVIGVTALGLQAMATKKPAAVAQPGEALHVETAGGRGPDYTMGDADKRVAKIARVSEKDWTAMNKNFNPNGPNSFE